jgi:hypothetical protein
MRREMKIVGRGSLVALAGVLGVFVFAGSASAHSGEFAKFNYCPSTNSEVFKCLVAVTKGGKIILGKKETPIVSPVTLQGGYSATNKEKKRISKFFAATNGITLSKAPQEVPGGLLGIVPPESSPPLVKLLSKWFFDNSITGVNATLELAKPASEIELDEFALAQEEGVALQLPVKVRLENPFLGSSCYVGSSSSPIIWNLTTGETTPPAGVTPLIGSAGSGEVKEEGQIIQLTGVELVDNDWSAPEATGCGGVLSFLVDPIINGMLGLPSKAGVNSSLLKNTIDIATAEAVNAH